jgi:hypothetical protein
MSNSVQLANTDFTFSNLTLANPQGLQGGTYFSKLRMIDEPVLIQTPKCYTKNGIHKTEKKIYCDLMFTKDNNDFIQWIESLESTIKNLIFEKRNSWFHNDMDTDSIDYHWQNLLRTYKGNKSLLRCFINKSKGLTKGYAVQIYNEEEEELKLDDVDKTTQMICILEVSGLKFTSQSFQIEFAVKQMMMIKEKQIFNKCLIKFNTPKLVAADVAADDVAADDVTADGDVAAVAVAADAAVTAAVADAAVAADADGAADSGVESDAESDISIEDAKLVQDVVEDKANTVLDISGSFEQTEEVADTVDISSSVLEENLETVEEKPEQAVQEESLDKDGIMNEIEILPPSENAEMVKLKNPNEVYMEIYKEARRKAKDAKKHAIQAYLEAKRIKSLYLLDEMDSSDDEIEFEEYER